MADKIDFEGIDSKELLAELDRRGDNVELGDFSDYDIIDHLQWNGYNVDPDLDDYDDDELTKELQSRGFSVWDKEADYNRDLLELYTTYQTMSPEFFEKELKKFFRENLNANIY